MNSCQPFREPSAKVSPKRGFAIVMALSLLSLVFLLVISLVNLVGIDLTLGDARKERVLAQAHARMGMMVAIGELQKHLGPDTRVSATADILDERIESGKKYETEIYQEETSANLSALVPLNQAIDLNENGQVDKVPFGQRYWTGVWKHRARRKGVTEDKRAGKPLPNNLETGSKISGTPATDSEFDPHPAVEVAWLVSGNEGWSKRLAHMQGETVKEYVEVPDGVPLDQRYFLEGGIYGKHPNAWEDYKQSLATLASVYDHPLNQLPEPEDNDDIVWMLKRPLLGHSFDPDRPETWREHIKGEPVKVRKTKIRSADINNNQLSNHGAYAYWVSDEGIKTKINIVTPLKDERVSQILNIEDYDEVKMTVALEPNLGEGSFGLGFDTPAEQNFQRSKHISLGLLEKDKFWLGLEAEKKAKLSSHYHSLTTSSYGLLTDTRTGGLKRDLSHAFANEEDWSQEKIDDLSDSQIWARDFQDYVYKDRIHYLKDIPMDPLAKANLWNDTSATQTVNDYDVQLAGPLWTILGSFHNLYKRWGNNGKIEEIKNTSAEALPRISGDNFAVFDPNKTPAGAGFWDDFDDPKGIPALRTRLNSFNNFRLRPGPSKHPIQPVLLEVKYSHIPTKHQANGEDFLAMAMYPSVALWNPYNRDIHLDDLFIEIPITNVSLKAFNPKDLDRWRKWWFYAWRCDQLQGGGGGGLPPVQPPTPPPSYPPPFGRIGPVGLLGESGMGGIILKNLLPLAILPQRNSPLISADRNPCEAFFNTVLRKRDQSHWRYRTNYDFVHHPSEHYQIFRSNKAIDPKTNEPPTRKSYRHLLLRIPNLKLKAGEKSHFTVGLHPETKDTQTWQYEPPSSNHEINQYVQVILQKELPTDLHPFICITDYALKPKDDEPVQPLCVKYELGNIEGVHPSQFILYDRFSDIDGNADRYKNETPKGVTMYSENPGRSNSYLTESKSINAKKPIYKISKTFETHVHSGWHISGKPDLNLQENRFNMADKFLPGNGFRIRYQLPGNADKIVLEQFNIRALVQSYQDGGGDNWTEEVFSGSAARGFNPNKIIDDLPLSSYPYMLPYEVDNEPEWAAVEFEPKQFKFFDFYKLKTKINHDESFMEVLTELPDPTFAIDPFNLSSQVMPRISLSKSKSVGFFHDLNEKHGNMVDNNTPVGFASLFDVPNSPMLSVMQLRHANLCDYSHAPSYILGNSYATTQVSRYKTWGRMRAISKEVESTRFNIQHNELNDKLWNEALSTASPWKYEIAKMNLFFDGTGRGYGPVRDENAQIDHQNTTVDHSFYTNRALLDGFFMTGVKKKWDNSALALKENEMSKYFEHLMGDKDKVTVTYPPFRNTRLKLFFENGVARETRFSEKTSGSLVAEDNILRYQTMAADLLIEGSFNINSTSVDAWISQLSAMKGDGASETPFPRFVNQPTENSWNKLRRLSDDEVRLLAHCLVEQIKLRGPFLSYSDFVNRRIQGNSSNRLDSHFNEWNKNYPETRDSVLGLRGAVQAAIAEAEINQSQFQKYGLTGNSFTGEKGEWPNNPMIPFIPPVRYNNTLDLGIPLLISGLDPVKFESSKFGLHAISKQRLLQPKSLKHTKVSFNDPRPPEDLLPNQREDFNKKVVESVYGQGMVPIENKYQGNMIWKGDPISFKIGWDDYSSALEFGEAPENLLAVENVATAANKPGWLMQSDILSPLLPVTNSRSDTFTIRVMGEPKSANSNKKNSRAWIELTVQRIPDFIKKDLDAPHHRPHEPFEDRNFNGYWDNDSSFVEHWLDLNQNGMDKEGERTLDVAVPDLPGGGGGNKRFADGLYSDVKLNRDVEEEPDTTLSRMGINQRFGRKFKIIKFRWIKEQDV